MSDRRDSHCHEYCSGRLYLGKIIIIVNRECDINTHHNYAHFQPLIRLYEHIIINTIIYIGIIVLMIISAMLTSFIDAPGQ